MLGRMRRCALGAALVGTAALGAAGNAVAAPRLVRPAPRLVGPSTRLPGRQRPHASHDVVTSSNWAGYAVQASSAFTKVTGSWTEPTVNCARVRGGEYSSFWAGIDGYASNSVEQLGTDADCDGTTPSYYAWYEMYPANSVNLSTTSYPVRPGDTLTATVAISGDTYTLSESDAREGWSFSTTISQSGLADSSAEMIAESPEICSGSRCSLAKLPDFGTVDFTGSQAATTSTALSPFSVFTSDGGPHEIVSETSSGIVRMQPSQLSGGENFSVTWEHS
jgi:hypothetical protein